MNFKKFSTSDNQWHDIPYYTHKTATDTLTTLPAVIYPNDTSITVGIKGNTTQSGTPTPDTPVTPQGTGDMTENLFDENNMDIGYWIASNGIVSSATYGAITNKLPLNNLDMTVYFHGTIPYSCSICWYHGSSFISRSHVPYNVIQAEESFTAPNNADSFIFQLAISSTGGDTITQEDINSFKCMMNEGSTPLPYEPYGYKIPILSASTTTPVYLGEVESTRRIKKLVFDGTGDWVQAVAGVKVYRINVSDYLREVINIPICTHYKGIAPVNGSGALEDLETAFLISTSGNNFYYIRDDRFNNANNFKSYLAAQYAAGTPVTVWYVLATPQTAVVNEPIRKIGDYADTVSGITIPTIAGANTLLVDTTLQPSEVTVNYKGWHPVQSVHEMHTHLDASLFELGTITGYGQKDELTTRIRTKTFIDLSNMKSINTLSSAKVFLIAWTEEATTIGYYYCVGGWNGSSFGNQTGLWLSEIDVESIVETYPTYKFAVILRYDDNREVTDFDDLLSLVDFYPKTW